MQSKKIAIGALAIASSFMFSSAAQAELIDLRIFPGLFDTRDTTTIESPAVIEAPVIQTYPAVLSPVTTEVRTVETRAAVVAPLETHEMIRAIPDTISNTTVRTLPAVVERTTTFPAIVSPLVDSSTSSTTVVGPMLSFDRLSLREAFLGLNPMDRLSDMMDQVSLGSTRGWLTADEVGTLNAERDRIAAMINSSAPGGLTMSEINQIEVALTTFNQTIASEVNDMEGSIAGSNLLF